MSEEATPTPQPERTADGWIVHAGKGGGGAIKPVRPGDPPRSKGRPSAGASIKEWFNALYETPEPELRKLARDVNEKPNRRAAAIEWLRILEIADMADFDELAEGDVTLSELRAKGIDTSVVKKFKVRHTKEGVEREVELHDRAGQSLDRVMDRTDGKPVQTVQQQTEVTITKRVILDLPQAQPVKMIDVEPVKELPHGS